MEMTTTVRIGRVDFNLAEPREGHIQVTVQTSFLECHDSTVCNTYDKEMPSSQGLVYSQPIDHSDYLHLPVYQTLLRQGA